MTRSRTLVVVVALSAGLALVVALGWMGVRQVTGSPLVQTAVALSPVTAARYAGQLAAVRLPDGCVLLRREHGGPYLADARGAYASASCRTRAPLPTAVAQVRAAMEEAGYRVEERETQEGVVRLEGTAPGRDLEARVGAGEVSASSYGRVPALPGTTGVLLLVPGR